MEDEKNDYVLTLFETCEILNKSSRSVSRYIRKGVLNPMGIKSRQGTLEYRFSRNEIEAFKKQEDELRQVTYVSTGAPIAGIAKFATVNFQEAPSTRQAPPVMPLTPDMTRQHGQQIEPDRPAPEAQDKNETVPKADVEEKIIPSADKEIITLLKETTEILRDQLQVKDEQIKSLNGKIDNLIERDRETNILLKGMQDKMMLLEKPKAQEEPPQKKRSIEEASSAVKYVPESEAKNRGDQARQDSGDKQEKQKKTKPVKQKKGFWGGLFG